MNLVLCMAGIYKRFREAGYTTPKFLLPWQGQTILKTILQEMLADNVFDQVLLVANQRDQVHESVLRDLLFSIKNQVHHGNIIFIPDTRGQAETAKIACEYLKQQAVKDERVIFHNIDTILTARHYQHYGDLLMQYDGLIDVFASNKACYSYVQINDQRLVVKIAEKIVISSLATTGLYGFRSYQSYIAAVNATDFQHEHYISDVYAYLLTQSAQFIVPEIFSHQQTIVLGTPAEYEATVNTLNVFEA